MSSQNVSSLSTSTSSAAQSIALRRKPWLTPTVIVGTLVGETEANLKGTKVGDYTLSGSTVGS